jgi:hypothetical protein
MENPIHRVEPTLIGMTRPDFEDYLSGFISRAGDQRTAGKDADTLSLMIR